MHSRFSWFVQTTTLCLKPLQPVSLFFELVVPQWHNFSQTRSGWAKSKGRGVASGHPPNAGKGPAQLPCLHKLHIMPGIHMTGAVFTFVFMTSKAFFHSLKFPDPCWGCQHAKTSEGGSKAQQALDGMEQGVPWLLLWTLPYLGQVHVKVPPGHHKAQKGSNGHMKLRLLHLFIQLFYSVPPKVPHLWTTKRPHARWWEQWTWPNIWLVVHSSPTLMRIRLYVLHRSNLVKHEGFCRLSKAEFIKCKGYRSFRVLVFNLRW